MASGSTISLALGRQLDFNSNQVLASGSTISLALGRQLDFNSNQVLASGSTISLALGRQLDFNSNQVLASGSTISLVLGRQLDFNSNQVLVSGSTISLVLGRQLDFNSNQVLVSGSLFNFDVIRSAIDFLPGNANLRSSPTEVRQTGRALLFTTSQANVRGSQVALLLDPYNLKFRAASVSVSGGIAQLQLIQKIRPPAIRPTDRIYTPPQWSYSQLPMEDGGTAGEILCNRPAGPSIDLVFENEDNSIGYDFLDSWSNALGRTKAITIPGPWTQGAKKPLRDLMRNPGTGAVWKYAEKPRVNFDVSPGICTVTVKIKAVIDGGITVPSGD